MLKIQRATRASRPRDNGRLLLTISNKCYHLTAAEETALRRWARREVKAGRTESLNRKAAPGGSRHEP